MIDFASDLAASFEAAQYDACSSSCDDEGEHTPSVEKGFNITGWNKGLSSVPKGSIVHF